MTNISVELSYGIKINFTNDFKSVSIKDIVNILQDYDVYHDINYSTDDTPILNGNVFIRVKRLEEICWRNFDNNNEYHYSKLNLSELIKIEKEIYIAEKIGGIIDDIRSLLEISNKIDILYIDYGLFNFASNVP